MVNISQVKRYWKLIVTLTYKYLGPYSLASVCGTRRLYICLIFAQLYAELADPLVDPV